MSNEQLGARVESDAFDTAGWMVIRLDGVEEISKPFAFTLTLARDGECPSLDDFVGGDIAVVVTQDGIERRRYAGMMREVRRRASPNGRCVLEISLVPRATRAQFVTNVRVHVSERDIDIVRQRMSLVGLGASDLQTRITGSEDVPHSIQSRDARDIVIQYRETDWDFVSRLLERDGVAYYFLHEPHGDVFVLADSPSGFESLPAAIPFHDRGERVDVFEIEEVRRLVPRTFVCRDYNYRTPTLLLSSDRVVREEGDIGGVFEYGLFVKTIDEANLVAKRLADAHVAGRDEIRGSCTHSPLGAGVRFRLDGHPTLTDELLATRVEHTLRMVVEGGAPTYENRFTAIPAARMPVPARTTPQPRIHGLVHAVVQTDAAGTIGKYAKIDGDGRYWVKFRFDPSANDDQATSCPVRMIQPSAGAGYGVHFPLRPGVEVLVAFIGGDPDRPIIVGAAPNAITPSPVTQTNSNKNRIRTASGAMIELDDGT